MKRWGWSTVFAILIVVAVWSWSGVWRTPEPPHCWRMTFSTGDSKTVCCDHITTSAPIGGYITVTAYDASDTIIGTYGFVYVLTVQK